MSECKLKKGDRIYECIHDVAILTELLTDPILQITDKDMHYWSWEARIISATSSRIMPGGVVEYGITEEAPAYGPKLFRRNLYEVGYLDAEPIIPPFDTK